MREPVASYHDLAEQLEYALELLKSEQHTLRVFAETTSDRVTAQSLARAVGRFTAEIDRIERRVHESASRPDATV